MFVLELTRLSVRFFIVYKLPEIFENCSFNVCEKVFIQVSTRFVQCDMCKSLLHVVAQSSNEKLAETGTNVTPPPPKKAFPAPKKASFSKY